MPKSKDGFSIDLLLKHPSWDPSTISRRLSIRPTFSWKRGDRSGGGVRRSTVWYGRICNGSGVRTFERALRTVEQFLDKNAAFLKEAANECGSVEIVLNHSGNTHEEGKAFELHLSSKFLADLAGSGVDLCVLLWNQSLEDGQQQERAR